MDSHIASKIIPLQVAVVHELAEGLLDGPRRFAKEWLDEGTKTVVPVAVSSPEAERLVTRFLTYAREAGISHVLFARTDEGEAGEEVVRIPTAHDGFPGMPPGCGGGFLLVLPDLWGSVLVTREGYALVAGNSQFIHMLVDAGVDEARARFSRQARRLRSSRPGMSAVSEELPPRRIASSTPAQVDPGSAVAEQLALMNSLVEGKISGAAFATGWLAARNRAMVEGERTRGVLDRALTDVFYALEDYAIDPALREPGDLSDHELTSRVRAALDTLRSLEAPPPDSHVL